jgi:hypothetical protein
VTGRDENRGEAAVQRLQDSAGNDQVYFIRADAATVGGNQPFSRPLPV